MTIISATLSTSFIEQNKNCRCHINSYNFVTINCYEIDLEPEFRHYQYKIKNSYNVTPSIREQPSLQTNVAAIRM